jgi:hypothetical protein
MGACGESPRIILKTCLAKGTYQFRHNTFAKIIFMGSMNRATTKRSTSAGNFKTLVCERNGLNSQSASSEILTGHGPVSSLVQG